MFGVRLAAGREVWEPPEQAAQASAMAKKPASAPDRLISPNLPQVVRQRVSGGSPDSSAEAHAA